MTASQLKIAIWQKATTLSNRIVEDAFLGRVRPKDKLLFVKLTKVANSLFEGMGCDELNEIECWYKDLII
jgi:hypothetical protein